MLTIKIQKISAQLKVVSARPLCTAGSKSYAGPHCLDILVSVLATQLWPSSRTHSRGAAHFLGGPKSCLDKSSLTPSERADRL